jgi:chromosome segregation ATPase
MPTLGEQISGNLGGVEQRVNDFNNQVSSACTVLQGLGRGAREQRTKLEDAQARYNILGLLGRGGILKDIARSVSNLEQNLIRAQARNVAIEQEKETLQTDLDLANQRLRDEAGNGNSDEIRRLRRDKRGLQTEVTRLRDENQRLQNRGSNENSSQVRRLEAQLERLEDQIASLEAENARLHRRPRSAPGNDQQLRDRITLLEAQNVAVQGEKTVLQQDKATLTQEKQTLETKIAELQVEVGLIRMCKKCQRKEDHPCRVRAGDVSFRKK